MSTHMVALQWNGSKLARDQLLGRAQSAVQVVQAQFDHLDQLNIQAIPDEDGQYVQLVIPSDCTVEDGELMRAMLKDEFTKTTPARQIIPASSLINTVSRSNGESTLLHSDATITPSTQKSLVILERQSTRFLSLNAAERSERLTHDLVPCTRCGSMILPTTAQRTGGFCKPCLKARTLEANDYGTGAMLPSKRQGVVISIAVCIPVAACLLWLFRLAFFSGGWGAVLIGLIVLCLLIFSLLDFLKEQKRCGANITIALIEQTAQMLLAGVGGGLSFLVLNHFGVHLYTFPDFKELDTQGGAWFWVFLFGFLTGLGLDAARVIRGTFIQIQ